MRSFVPVRDKMWEARPPDVTINVPADWAGALSGIKNARGRRFTSLVDPMILRAADVLVEGRTGDDETDRKRWAGISGNLSALMAFFDLLVFEDVVPMIDYGQTFQPSDGAVVGSLYDSVVTMHDQITRKTPVADRLPQPLVTVHVRDVAHQAARDNAIGLLRSHGTPQGELAASIESEMTEFDHQWRPRLAELDERFGGEYESRDRTVATWVYGGLLFGEFAEQAGAAHCLHDKRRRLDTAVALEAPSASFDVDAKLERQLNEILEQAQVPSMRVQGSEALPSVLPFLLDHERPHTAEELVLAALELRQKSMARQFSAWRHKVTLELVEMGTVSDKTERDMRALAEQVRAHLTPAAADGMTNLADALPAGAIGGPWYSALRLVPIPSAWKDRLWNWTLRQAPGGMHVKMLYELQLADRKVARAGRMQALTLQLQRIWDASKAA